MNLDLLDWTAHYLWFVLVTFNKTVNTKHIERFVSSSVFMPLIEHLYEYFWKVTYHKDGLAMRLGLGRVLARLGEPEGDELRVSTLGSNSSISSTSSCRSTSWSRMHLTEYCPKTLSCVATKRIKWCDAVTKKPDIWFKRQRSSTYQLLLQLMSFSCLMKRAPGPQSLNQSPKPHPL